MTEREEVKRWQEKISRAEEVYRPFHELVKETRAYYKNDRKKNKQNVFWASIETLKPFLYFKQPKPYIDRKEKSDNPVAAAACQMITRALLWDLEQFDFDSVIKYVRNDFLISGIGIAEEKYMPEFEEISGDEQMLRIKKSEKVITTYVDPVDFIADCEKVGIWENVTWVARKIWMTKQEAIDSFGDEVRELIVEPGEEEYQKKDILIYKIWDKEKAQIYWLARECKTRFLKISADWLKLPGFFPLPKPIFASQTNDSLIPSPDYAQILPQLKELDGITERMRLTMQALKVSGAYDNSFPELASILEKDVTLVALADFDRLKEAGGISGIIDFAPIAQYIDALKALAERRQDLLARIYEVTGVSDIMRGNSDPSETATAVTKKTNFGTLRNQDRQNDMQRFITELLKIKAEIICERFSPEFLLSFLDEREFAQDIALSAVKLLKTRKMDGYVLGIDTDIAFKQEAVARQALETVKTLSDMIAGAFQTVSAQPLLLPLYRQMLLSVTQTLPQARQFETVIEQCLNQIAAQLKAPKSPSPDPAMLKLQLESQKLNNQALDNQVKNRLELMKIEQQAGKDLDDSFLKNKEMELQKQIKQAEIISKASVGNNITTGYVKEFA